MPIARYEWIIREHYLHYPIPFGVIVIRKLKNSWYRSNQWGVPHLVVKHRSMELVLWIIREQDNAHHWAHTLYCGSQTKRLNATQHSIQGRAAVDSGSDVRLYIFKARNRAWNGNSPRMLELKLRLCLLQQLPEQRVVDLNHRYDVPAGFFFLIFLPFAYIHS